MHRIREARSASGGSDDGDALKSPYSPECDSPMGSRYARNSSLDDIDVSSHNSLDNSPDYRISLDADASLDDASFHARNSHSRTFSFDDVEDAELEEPHSPRQASPMGQRSNAHPSGTQSVPRPFSPKMNTTPSKSPRSETPLQRRRRVSLERKALAGHLGGHGKSMSERERKARAEALERERQASVYADREALRASVVQEEKEAQALKKEEAAQKKRDIMNKKSIRKERERQEPWHRRGSCCC